MIQNPYFYIVMSFILVLFVSYKKLWPPLNFALQDDINQLKEEFHKMNVMQSTLDSTLKTLKKEEDTHLIFLNSIQAEGKERIEQMTDHHKKVLEKIIADRQSQVKEMLIREREKFKKTALIELSKDLEDELRKSIVQKNFLDKAFDLLAQKDAA